LKDVSQAVVIGGGLIGVSVAEALTKCGLKVIIVEMKERVLNTILDERGSSLAAERLSQAGLKIVTGHTVAEIWGNKHGMVKGVALDSGEDIPCGLAIVAIGVTPSLELVKESQMKLNRGIVVGQHMATSIPGVYACGDVAEAYDLVYGASRLTPIWPNAYLGGRVAGCNMAGVEANYIGGTAMNALNYFGLAMVSAGLVTPQDGGCEVLSRQYGQSYRKLVLKEGRLAGMVFVGDIEPSGIFFDLLREGVVVADFKSSLLEADFGLACLPSTLWQKRLGVPSKKLSLPQSPRWSAVGE
jgi:NAD(P)H-nitrite reductase large subunit